MPWHGARGAYNDSSTRIVHWSVRARVDRSPRHFPCERTESVTYPYSLGTLGVLPNVTLSRRAYLCLEVPLPVR